MQVLVRINLMPIKKKKKMTQVDEQQQQNCFHKKMVHILKSSLMVKTRKSFDFVSWFMI